MTTFIRIPFHPHIYEVSHAPFTDGAAAALCRSLSRFPQCHAGGARRRLFAALRRDAPVIELLTPLPHIRAALRERGIDPPRGAHPSTQRRKTVVRLPAKGLTFARSGSRSPISFAGNAA